MAASLPTVSCFVTENVTERYLSIYKHKFDLIFFIYEKSFTTSHFYTGYAQAITEYFLKGGVFSSNIPYNINNISKT